MKNYTESRIREFILDDHPCVMAQSVIADESVTIKSYEGMKSSESLHELLVDLENYKNSQNSKLLDFESFIAVFKNDKFLTEIAFENALWTLLKALANLDESSWDPATSSNPDDPTFSYSLFTTAFYIVGMHPMSSRFARKSPYTCVVFNLHSQFETLRSKNRYTRVRDLIRRRDTQFQGFINPVLEDFGTTTEARQYSGRQVDQDWKCPFNFKK